MRLFLLRSARYIRFPMTARRTRILPAEGRLDFNNAIWVYGSGDDDPGVNGETRGCCGRPVRAGFRPEEVNPGLVIVGIWLEPNAPRVVFNSASSGNTLQEREREREFACAIADILRGAFSDIIDNGGSGGPLRVENGPFVSRETSGNRQYPYSRPRSAPVLPCSITGS